MVQLGFERCFDLRCNSSKENLEFLLLVLPSPVHTVLTQHTAAGIVSDAASSMHSNVTLIGY